jgi:hypothetical protein
MLLFCHAPNLHTTADMAEQVALSSSGDTTQPCHDMGLTAVNMPSAASKHVEHRQPSLPTSGKTLFATTHPQHNK